MKIVASLNNLLRPAKLTHGRMAVALIAALVADGKMDSYTAADQLLAQERNK